VAVQVAVIVVLAEAVLVIKREISQEISQEIKPVLKSRIEIVYARQALALQRLRLRQSQPPTR
jgi:hypothetical protein